MSDDSPRHSYIIASKEHTRPAISTRTSEESSRSSTDGEKSPHSPGQQEHSWLDVAPLKYDTALQRRMRRRRDKGRAMMLGEDMGVWHNDEVELQRCQRVTMVRVHSGKSQEGTGRSRGLSIREIETRPKSFNSMSELDLNDRIEEMIMALQRC